jgi:plasmid maintenance system antidote protein VapI
MQRLYASRLIPEEKNSPWREALDIDEPTEIGIVLKGMRIKAHMTQKDLAELLGTKQHHISEMEHGARPIGKAMAHRLARIFKVDYRIFL